MTDERTCGNCEHAELWNGEYTCTLDDVLVLKDRKACHDWIESGDTDDCLNRTEDYYCNW